MEDRRPMRIGELSDRTGVSPRSLRYYESQGLIRSVRSAGGWRCFDEATVDRVIRIQHLFAAGLSGRLVQDVLPCLDANLEDRSEFLANALDQRLAELRSERNRLDEEIAVLLELREREAPAAKPPRAAAAPHGAQLAPVDTAVERTPPNSAGGI